MKKKKTDINNNKNIILLADILIVYIKERHPKYNDVFFWGYYVCIF